MLTILDNTIRMIDGLYSLNDLHRASGGENKHAPYRFIRLANTRALITEIERSPDMVDDSKYKACKVIQGGNPYLQGTYVCRDLVYSYAMWISPSFALKVIRAFDEMTRHQQSLNNQFNHLCQQHKLVTANLSQAGRYLCIAGKQEKPRLQQAIDNTLKQLQLCLNFEPTGDYNHE